MTDAIARAVESELRFARRKFPAPKQLLHAFTEEAGEVTKAFLDLQAGKGKAESVTDELIQAIAMAVRLLQEGDPEFPEYKPAFPDGTKCAGV